MCKHLSCVLHLHEAFSLVLCFFSVLPRMVGMILIVDVYPKIHSLIDCFPQEDVCSEPDDWFFSSEDLTECEWKKKLPMNE